MRSFLLLLGIVLVMGGCNSSKNMAKLNGVKWVLQTLNGKELNLSDPNNEIFIQFNETEHRVNGCGGCNRFFGNYEMEANRLKFSPMGATRMTCPDIKIESEFFKMLDSVDGYSIKDNRLTFFAKNRSVAVFKKAEEIQ